MLAHNDLKKGTQFMLDNEPYEVLESAPVFKGRGGSVMQTKIKNLLTGNVLARNFHAGDQFKEVDIQRINVKFIYAHRDKLIFTEEDNPAKRFELAQAVLGKSVDFLKPNQVVTGIKFKEQIINIVLPVKLELKVKEAPPGVKGDRAQGGTKVVTLETGAPLNVPLFIKTDDVVEVNTERGEYVRRIEN